MNEEMRKRFGPKDKLLLDESQLVTDGKFNYAADYLKDIAKRVNEAIGERGTYGDIYIKEDPKHGNNSVIKLYAYVPMNKYDPKRRKASIKELIEKALSGLDVKLENDTRLLSTGNVDKDFRVGAEDKEDESSLVDFVVSLPGKLPFSEVKADKDTVDLTYFYDSKPKWDAAGKGEEIAKLIAREFKGECGPFSGENPHLDGNTMELYSQAGSCYYTFNDDGSIDVKYELDEEFEDDEYELPSHYDSLKELLESDDSWFTYFPGSMDVTKKVEMILKKPEMHDEKDSKCKDSKADIMKICVLLGEAHDKIMEAQDLVDDLAYDDELPSDAIYDLEDLEAALSEFDFMGEEQPADAFLEKYSND